MAQQNQHARRLFVKAFKTIMKSHRVRIAKYQHLPLRLRPWFLLFTTLVMFVLAFLGFTNFSRSLPLNDKALHFLCFGLATAVFYFIIDVEEDQRRVWFWRNANLIITGFVCFFCGGILSEFVQSMLPVRSHCLCYKEFQFGDVVANLLGSSLGLLASYHLERYYRKRREIARLYQPLDSGSMSDLEDEDDGVQLLPTHHSGAAAPKGGQKGSTRLTDVWDEREELFGIGGDSDDEDSATPRPVPARQPAPQQHPASPVPKIFVTAE
ncbi:hypothetical protein MSAN_01005200 [Mycena sanguinolenta]|uniref:VanZ-like domain-containing protein n=1 Tax=Mycena sanguinolenta TaxID=230812 RepID=A0A8H7D9C1_9AGAR|nr:hypothetical protein MSAN_01005200 [Mycena sanguinolenta]